MQIKKIISMFFIISCFFTIYFSGIAISKEGFPLSVMENQPSPVKGYVKINSNLFSNEIGGKTGRYSYLKDFSLFSSNDEISIFNEIANDLISGISSYSKDKSLNKSVIIYIKRKCEDNDLMPLDCDNSKSYFPCDGCYYLATAVDYNAFFNAPIEQRGMALLKNISIKFDSNHYIDQEFAIKIKKKTGISLGVF